MPTHYFFKLKKQNEGLEQFPDWKNLPISIYFGGWRVDDYKKGKVKFKENVSESQVKEFFSIEGQDELPYFWLFKSDEAFLFRAKKNIIQDGEDPNEVNPPKIIYSSLENRWKKIDLPELFANINSNQAYNRRTISRLKDEALEIAKHLSSPGNKKKKFSKMKIPKNNRLNYLSPVQFETLIALIFIENDIYCSTFRGGTLEKYDLKINVKKSFDQFRAGPPQYIQIKKKILKKNIDNRHFTIHLGKTEYKDKLLGIDWIMKHIEQSEYIVDWLKQSLDFFEITKKSK